MRARERDKERKVCVRESERENASIQWMRVECSFERALVRCFVPLVWWDGASPTNVLELTKSQTKTEVWMVWGEFCCTYAEKRLRVWYRTITPGM